MCKCYPRSKEITASLGNRSTEQTRKSCRAKIESSDKDRIPAANALEANSHEAADQVGRECVA